MNELVVKHYHTFQLLFEEAVFYFGLGLVCKTNRHITLEEIMANQ